MKRLLSFLVAGTLSLALLGCGDDDTADDATVGDDPSDQVDESGAGDEASGDESSETDDSEETTSGAGGGTLTFDGEEIALDSSRCTFEEQDAAAGGGTIEFVAQGTGTTAAGDEVLVDVSRYSEESQFAGDRVSITIGDFATGASYSGSDDAGTVSEDGATVEADDFPLVSDDDLSETTITFSIDCG